MTFNDDARIDTSKVSRRGRTTGIAIGGGGGLLVIGLFILSQFLGVDLTGLAGGQQQEHPGESIGTCTGQDANSDLDCRIAGAADSLDTYWSDELPQFGVDYRTTNVVLFEGQTSTGCGGATSAVGPFYCPPDETIYIDTSFYDELQSRFGSSGGPLAQMYVVAHEWGHHIQNISGIMNGLNLQDTGPASDAVRLELQADCFAGAWVGAAPSILNDDGVAFLEPVTDAQVRDALSAASAVGDDRIQESTTGQVSPEAWTHGSSEMRQRWFTAGLKGGPNACNTFEVAGDQL
ncbi:KPN_02809 family neutral zinc metallopeptidase [Schumannella luteola]